MLEKIKKRSLKHFVIINLRENSIIMVLKISRGIWFFSVLGVLDALMVVYAALPLEVAVQQTDTGFITLSKEAVFYIALALSAIINSLVFVIGAFFPNEKPFRTWFNGLIITLNTFTIIALFTLNAVNTTEKFDFSRITFLIYGSLILVILWCAIWPLWSLYRKFFPKDLVE